MKKSLFIYLIIIIAFLACNTPYNTVDVVFEKSDDPNDSQNITVDSYEDDDLSSDASIILLGENNEQLHSIYPKEDVDWIKFTAYTGRYYTIDSTRLSGTYIFMTFYDPSIDEVIRSGYSDINYWLCDKTGDHYILIKGEDQESLGEYSIKIEEYNTIPNTPLLGNIVSYYSDYVKLYCYDQGMSERFYVYRSTSSTGSYTQIDIYRNNNSELSYQYIYDNIAYDRSATPGIIYYYKIRGWNKNGFSDYSEYKDGYRVDVSADNYESDDTTTDASEASIGESNEYIHSIYPKNDIDWIKFYAVSGETYTIKTNSDYDGRVSTNVFLFDGMNNLLDVGYSSEYDYTTSITDWYCDTTGYYFVKVENIESFTGIYTITVY